MTIILTKTQKININQTYKIDMNQYLSAIYWYQYHCGVVIAVYKISNLFGVMMMGI
jgi:hypothetical protein